MANDTISFVLLDTVLRSSIFLMNAFLDQFKFKYDVSPALTYVSFFSSFCNDAGPPTLPIATCVLNSSPPALRALEDVEWAEEEGMRWVGEEAERESRMRVVMPLADYTSECFQNELWFCPERDYHVRDNWKRQFCVIKEFVP